MLPRHVHAVTWRSGRVAYYWQQHRGTAQAGPRIRLPDDPSSSGFWQAVKALQDGERPPGGIAAMIDAYQASPHYLGLGRDPSLASDPAPADVSEIGGVTNAVNVGTLT